MSQSKKFITFKSEFNKFLSLQIPNSNDINHKAIKYAISNGGKRIRAYLLFTLGKHFGISKNVLNILGASIEMIHAYSLVHDDLPCMDDDDLRRPLSTRRRRRGTAPASQYSTYTCHDHTSTSGMSAQEKNGQKNSRALTGCRFRCRRCWKSFASAPF